MGNPQKIVLLICALGLASTAAYVQANDLCSGATPMICGDTMSGSTSMATFDDVGFCGTSNTAPGVWYSFVGDGSAVTASTCNSANYDTKISVFTGSCGALTCLDGNDDTAGCDNFTSELTWCTEPGVEYFILVHGFSSNTGDFDLSLSCAPAPANDNVCDAAPLGVETTAMNNRCATAEPGEVTPPGGSGLSSCDSQDGWCDFPAGVEPGVQNSIWYSLVVPTSRSVSIETSGFDTQLALWAAKSCDDLTSSVEQSKMALVGAVEFRALDQAVTRAMVRVPELIAANDDGGPGTGSFVGPSYCLRPNTNYWIQVDGWNGAAGEGPITVTELDANVTLCHDTEGRDPRTITVGACATQIHLDHGDIVGMCPPACEEQDPVTLCHNPDGKKPVTLEVSACAAPSHFAHGDRPGDCSFSPLTLTLTTDNFASETSWVLEDITAGIVIDSRERGDLASNTTNVDEYFVDGGHCFEFSIFDAFGDGICCSFGNGDYSLTLEGMTVPSPSGGAFGDSETVQIGNCP